MFKQAIYYPIMLFSRLANGDALDVAVKSPMYETKQFGDMPLLDVSASYNEETGTNTVFIVNRSQKESIPVNINWQALQPSNVKSAYQLSGTDPKAANSFANPNMVTASAIDTPEIKDGSISVMLPALSFTTLEVSL